jgi:hypothetical protein
VVGEVDAAVVLRAAGVSLSGTMGIEHFRHRFAVEHGQFDGVQRRGDVAAPAANLS